MAKKIVLVVAILMMLQGCTATTSPDGVVQARGVVTAVEPLPESQGMEGQTAVVSISSGPHAGQKVTISHVPLQHSVRDFNLQAGHRLLLALSVDGSGRLVARSFTIARADYLAALGAVLVTCALLFGRSRGVASLLALLFSGLVIVRILIPAILSGRSAIPAAIACTALIMIASFILIGGFTRKTAAAFLGTVGGSVIAGLMAKYSVDIMAITGTAHEDVAVLISEFGASVNYKGLLLAGILIGTIGVVMDVAMSISSFVFEVKAKSPHASAVNLIASGLTVGRDVMATMINTLVLAYAGTSIPLFLAYHFSGYSSSAALSSEAVAGELIRALCGSVGLILTIPFTAISASMLACGEKRVPLGHRTRRRSH